MSTFMNHVIITDAARLVKPKKTAFFAPAGERVGRHKPPAVRIGIERKPPMTSGGNDMENANSLYQDMAARTGGDIYLGVVGPVRTGT